MARVCLEFNGRWPIKISAVRWLGERAPLVVLQVNRMLETSGFRRKNSSGVVSGMRLSISIRYGDVLYTTLLLTGASLPKFSDNLCCKMLNMHLV